MIRSEVRSPLARLTRTRRGWLPIAGWAALALLSALMLRGPGRIAGAEHGLRGTVGVVVIPLVTYGIVSACLGGIGLRASMRGMVALGASPVRAALASVVVAMAASAAVCGAVALLVCVIAHGPGDPPLFADAVSSLGIACIGGVAYASYFAAGSAIGKGAMRGGFLVIDWLLGASSGFGAVFTPRGHVTSLLGGALCFDLSRRTSSVLLVALALGYVALTLRLARRAR